MNEDLHALQEMDFFFINSDTTSELLNHMV